MGMIIADKSFIIAVFLCFMVQYYVLADKCMYIDYRGRNASKTEFNCSSSKICQKSFKISYINFPPYSTAYLLESMLQKCCGKCTRFEKVNEFKNISEVSLAALNNSDFILPFIGRPNAKTLYGYLFIPIVDVPNMFYFTPRHKSIMEELIIGCLSLYPLIILCLLMAVISGFIVWSIETWHDRTQFPRSFLPGVFEGFWYSFVSMTTVGYGDRIVKSIPARLFSVIWILIGIIMFGLLTSLFTAEILKATQPHEHSMSGSKVGALKYRDYDATVIVKQGGVVKESNAWNFYSDILMLARMLRTEEIDGFIIDKYTLAYITGYFEWKKNNLDTYVSVNKTKGESYEERKVDIEFFSKKTYKTIKHYDGEKLSYGVLVKNQEDYDYFRHAIQDNRFSLETSVGSVMNEIFPRGTERDIFSSSGIYYQETIKVIGIVLGLITLFGMVFELHTRRGLFCKLRRKTKNVQAITPTPLLNRKNSASINRAV